MGVGRSANSWGPKVKLDQSVRTDGASWTGNALTQTSVRGKCLKLRELSEAEIEMKEQRVLSSPCTTQPSVQPLRDGHFQDRAREAKAKRLTQRSRGS